MRPMIRWPFERDVFMQLGIFLPTVSWDIDRSKTGIVRSSRVPCTKRKLFYANHRYEDLEGFQLSTSPNETEIDR